MIAARAAAAIGERLAGVQALRGGDLSELRRLVFEGGGTAVLKTGRTAPAEAAMLVALAEAGAPVPAVLATGADFLLMSDLGRDDGLSEAWPDLARVLRQLYAVRGPDYGWPQDHAFGPVPILNAPSDDWPRFWADRRLRPFLPHLPADLARRIEALADRLPQWLPTRPPAALLHGDLWTGNVMAQGRRVAGLIDPACYWGHAEVDLAMLCLFATPPPAFWSALHADHPPEPGIETRRPLYQLWPALVHLRLFGAGYRGLVERCLSPFA